MKLPRNVLACLLAAAMAGGSAFGCTIFVLTDGTRALFFNNEDWSNPNTRIWFVPRGKDYKGAVYVGFDDGWAQGGMNSDGLAFDWVAGFNDKWKGARGMKATRGNSSQRMVETCATVEEAIRFYETHWEPEFWRARMLVADATGASAILGAENGKLKVDRANGNRGFGYGGAIVNRMLSERPDTLEESGMRILNACAQPGEYATKYSNVFDLRAKKISLFFPGRIEVVASFDLTEELNKGGSFYDIPQIEQQRNAEVRPLPPLLKRFAVDEWKPLANQDRDVNALIRRLLTDAAKGKMRAQDYSEALWADLSKMERKVQADLKRLGPLKSVAQVERGEKDGRRLVVCKAEFARATVVQRFELDGRNRCVASESVASELRLD